MYSRIGDVEPRLPTWKYIVGIFLPSLLIFVLLDAAWIGFIANDLYKSQLSSILKATVDPIAAVGAWSLIVGGCQLMVLPKSILTGSPITAMCQGALYGLILYGVCDLTNCATLVGWSWELAVIDWCWGCTACSLVALIQLLVYKKLA